MTVDMPPPEPKKTSPWMWVGLGCGGVALLCVVVLVAGGLFFYTRMKSFQKQFDDPAVRAQRVSEILGAKELPEGYYPFMTFSVPWVLDVVMLSDHEFVKPSKGERREHSNFFDKWGFIYVRTPYRGRDDKWQEFLDGKRNPDELLQGRNVHFHPRDTVAKGEIPGAGGATYHYVATRGEVEMGRDVKDGITTVIGVECPGDQKLRIGVWIGPDPTAKPAEGSAPPPAGAPSGKPGEIGTAPAAFAGSTADEAAIRSFMDHFTLCQ